MSMLWKVLGKPLAALGGRSFEEMKGCSAGDCDKSFAVGLMCLVSVAIIFAGHGLFWRNFPNLADIALTVAACIAALFVLLYRVALRSMETMGVWGKAAMLLTLVGLMGVNATLAGHELVLLAFKPQVEAQTKLGAAQDLTVYTETVEKSLGLPQLRSNSKELDQAFANAQAERSRIPDAVQQLRRQARACDGLAERQQLRIPPNLDDPRRPAALGALREQRARCSGLDSQAASALAQHQAQVDVQLRGLSQSQDKLRHSLDAANSEHEGKLRGAKPALEASATTGFARHAALWAAVAAGTVPAWAAFGLMFGVLALDGFSFLIKLLARDDAATADRIQTAGTTQVYNQLHAAMLRQQRGLIAEVVRSLREQSMQDLIELSREAVMPSVLQGLEERSFTRAAGAHKRARQATGATAPSMLGRLARMAGAMRRRHAGGESAGSAAA